MVIVRGGIAVKIRKTVENNYDRYLTEEQAYGNSEMDLYKLLQGTASKRYKENMDIKGKVIGFFKDNYPRDLFDIYDKHFTIELKDEKKFWLWG